MDESIEGNFDLINCEEEAVTQGENDESAVKVQDEVQDSLEDQVEESSVTSEEKCSEGQGQKGELEDAFDNETENPEDQREVDEKKGEVVDTRYRCSSCGKDFKFLTYLKGHQSSKTNCNSSVAFFDILLTALRNERKECIVHF